MIPRHRPPFASAAPVVFAVGGMRAPGVGRLEEQYTARLGARHAVWTPSGRAAIAWALEARGATGGSVVCPAFTCGAVHEAILHAGCQPVPVDVAADGFLMDSDEFRIRLQTSDAAVLCEIYGHSFDDRLLSDCERDHSRLYIRDMAMCLPERQCLNGLPTNMAAVLSFGTGKCLNAGWGGMLLTNNAELAESVRRIRDQRTVPLSSSALVGRWFRIVAQTATHHRLLYRNSRRVVETARRVRQGRMRDRETERLSELAGKRRPLKPEWSLGSSSLDRRLAELNLQRLESDLGKRRSHAERYRQLLSDVDGIRLPPSSSTALSHFTIRIAADRRDRCRQQLHSAGIDTGTLFSASESISIPPRTQRLIGEVVNLPLSPDLAAADIDRIAVRVERLSQSFRRS